MTDTQERFEIVDTIRIPTLPVAVEHIRAVLERPDVAIGDVAKAFLKDPPLAAKVLCIANSVHYGSRESITSVQQAVSLLGLRALSTVVLRAGLSLAFKSIEQESRLELNFLWRHSILTAQVAERVGARCRRRAGDLTPQDHYTCGLLHDIGKIVLFDNLGAHYLEVLHQARESGQALELEEQNRLGMRHSDVGSMAAVLWHLPEPIPSVIRCHHRPHLLGPLTEVARAVCCADEIANAVAHAPRSSPRELLARVHSVPAGLPEDDLLNIIAAALESWDTIEI